MWLPTLIQHTFVVCHCSLWFVHIVWFALCNVVHHLLLRSSYCVFIYFDSFALHCVPTLGHLHCVIYFGPFVLDCIVCPPWFVRIVMTHLRVRIKLWHMLCMRLTMQHAPSLRPLSYNLRHHWSFRMVVGLVHLSIHDERTWFEAQGGRTGLEMMKCCVFACDFASGIAFRMLQNAHPKPAAPMGQSPDCGKRRSNLKALS